MNKQKIVLLGSLFTIPILIYFIFLKTKYTEYKTFKSPNGAFSLVVYMECNPYCLSFNSDFEYMKAFVELKDKNNTVVVNPSIFSNCDFAIGDLNVSWDTSNKIVYYNKFDSIDLQQMKMSCN